LLKLNPLQNMIIKEGILNELEKKWRQKEILKLFFLSSEPFRLRKDGYEIGQYTNEAQTVLVDGEMFSW
jgi:hypothetical protein